MKVLIVEDETDTLETMGRFLTRHRFETILTTSQEEALIQFDSHQPDIVVSDMCLNQGNGLALYRELFDRHSDAPFILVSAYTDKDSLLEAFRLGVNMVLTKPIRMKNLMQTIIEVHNKSQKVQEMEKNLTELSRQFNLSQYHLKQIENRARRLINPIKDLSQDINYFSKPVSKISGDLFSEYKDPSGLHYLFLADTSGHGVDAAMPAFFVPKRFTDLARQNVSIQFIATQLNEELYALNLPDFFITLTLACFNPVQNRLLVINCGNPPALLLDHDNRILTRFESGEMALGILPNGKFNPRVEELSIKGNCQFYCYTDGLNELEDAQGLALGTEFIEHCLSHTPPPYRLDGLLTELDPCIKHSRDDLTIIDFRLSYNTQHSHPIGPAEAHPTKLPNLLGGAKILFIQDPQRQRPELLEFLKRRIGHLYYSHNYSEALCLFGEFAPDLVLLDIDMTSENGLAMIKVIRKSSPTVPVVMFQLLDNNFKQLIESLTDHISGFISDQEHYPNILDKLKHILAQNQALKKQLISSQAFQSSENAMIITDHNMRILTVNQAFTQITGYSEQEVYGHTPKILSSGRHSQAFYREMWNAINARQHWTGEIWNRRKNGEIFLEWLTINSIKGSNGKIRYFTASFQDITQRKKTEKRINFLAFNDQLTKLPNRALFYDRLSQWLLQTKRNQRQFAVMFIDLDHFKHVNDSLGHAVGDELLQQAAQRMVECLRKSDTVARLSGDEFAILLTEAKKKSDIIITTQKLISELARPFLIDGNQLHITASIGITCCPDDGDNLETIMKNADIAMYHAKENGRNHFEFFKTELNKKLQTRIELRNSLFDAVDNNEFALQLQPKFHLESQEIVGAEALLRWHHPKLGLTMPDQFIEIAEESIQIIPIGEWIVQKTCQMLEILLAQGKAIPIAINVSAVQFLRSNFAETLKKNLAQFNIPPHLLEVEITESSLLIQQNSIIHQLQAIQRQGHAIAIDDFGIGYSSLSYLKRFPINQLKIDRSFMPSVVDGKSSNRSLTIAIIQMAKALELDIIAEGVETEEQRQFLLQQGCSLAQGYLFSKPLDFDQFVDLITNTTH